MKNIISAIPLFYSRFWISVSCNKIVDLGSFLQRLGTVTEGEDFR